MTLRPFHLAIPVDDLENARLFYGETMGCGEGRSDTAWNNLELKAFASLDQIFATEAQSENAPVGPLR